jgi:hypothetical protein
MFSPISVKQPLVLMYNIKKQQLATQAILRKLVPLNVWGVTKLEAQWAEPVSLTFPSALRKFNTEPSYQVSVHMAKQFQRRRFFRNRPIKNKNCMLWSCLLTDRDEMSNLHRGHSIDDAYQVSVVAMFANWSEQNEQSS